MNCLSIINVKYETMKKKFTFIIELNFFSKRKINYFFIFVNYKNYN